MIYEYKGTNYKVFTGSKGGLYILVNNKKHYVKSRSKKIKQEEEDLQICNSKGDSGYKETRRDNYNDKKPSKSEMIHYLYYYVPDPEHEGDIDYALHEMDEIGDYELGNIDREYTDDGEELVEACIHFTCKDDVYPKFKEFCRL